MSVAGCGRWLESQSSWVALQMLRTHARGASRPRRQAVRAFRAWDSGAAGERRAIAPRRRVAIGSRFFEFGAYAAVAAALMSTFSGTRMARDGHRRRICRRRSQGFTLSRPAREQSPGTPGVRIANRAARKSTNRGWPRLPCQFQKTQSASRQVLPANIDRQGFVVDVRGR